jgi:hypothetical protein
MAKPKILKTYFVVESMEAWTEYEIQATSKAEAIRKIRDGALTDEEKENSWSESSGPTGKYVVSLIDD